MAELPPTTKQQRMLRALAARTGTTFTPPRTRAEASAEISRLGRGRASGSTERRIESSTLRRAVEEERAASSVREDEITGYGSSARWR